MSRMLSKLIVLSLVSSIVLFHTKVSHADVNLPWSTTYNCGEWTQLLGLDIGLVNCDGLKGMLASLTAAGSAEQITSAANYSGGGGGRGQRHWIGQARDSDNSGGLRIDLNTPQTELWIRWYMRYETGFLGHGMNSKWLYINPGELHAVYMGYYNNDQTYFHPNGYPGNVVSAVGTGWDTVQGGATSDGRWHLYEVHLKLDTNGADGVAEMWIDEAQIISQKDIDFRNPTGWTYVVIGSNQKVTGNPRDMYIDYDDVEISNTGYIGPINGRPIPPKNLQVR